MKTNNGNPGQDPLRVLILEDIPADAELVVRELRRAALVFTSRLVAGKKEFSEALAAFQPQVILSDFMLPRFDGMSALKIARRQAPDTPFLFVSGSIGEEKAIETLAQGASDYIFKDNLARLGPAVKRVLAAAEWKRQKLEAEKSLGESERMFSTLVANLPGFVYRCRNDHDWTMEYISPGCREVTGYAPEDFLFNRKLAFNSIIHPDHRDTVWQEWQERLRRRLPFEFEYRITTAAGELRWVWERGQGIFGPDGALLFLEGFVTDITPRRQMEDRLRESEEKYRTLVETSPDAIVIVDAGGRVVFASRKTLDLFGVSPQTSLIGSSILDFVEPAEIPRVQQRLVEILAGRALPQVREYRLHWRDCRPFWGEVSAAPLSNAAGRSAGLLLILRDVSERKHAEERIRYQAGLLQDVSDAIIATDSHNDIQAWNKAAERIYGWKAEEAIGKNFHSLIKPEYRFQSRDEVVEKLNREGAWSGEIIHHLRSGKQIPVQSTITILEDAAGGRSGLVSSNHDISERLQAEERLQESDQLLKNLTAQVPGMVYTFRRKPDGSYSIPYSSNAIRGIFGVSPQDVTDDAAAIFTAIIPGDRPRVVATIEDSARTLSPWQVEYRVQLPGKPVRWMLGQSEPVRLADGSVLWYGFNTDITERKAAEELIHRSLKEKDVLLQEIHHRVKNNLQVISGLLTLQADQSAGKPLDEIFRESQDRIRSIALIHEKLYRSHSLAEIAFDEYLRALTENLFTTHSVEAGRITTRYEMETILLTIEKAIPLGLIVNELVSNSLKHAFPAGRRGVIRIGLHGYQGAKSFAQKSDSGTIHVVPTIELVVADDGIGLPAGQSPLGQKTLGMNLVTMLAQQLRAELKINTGIGAEFCLRFPGLPGGGKTAVNEHDE